MGPLERMILGYFVAQNWQVERHDTEPYVRFEYANETGSWVCLIWFIEELSQVLIYSLYPEKVATDRRSAVSTFFTHVNYGQVASCFEINLEDGETRCRTGVDFGAGEIDTAPFASALQTNLLLFGDHLAALQHVIAGRSDPKDAALSLLDDRPDLDMRGGDT